MIIDSPSAKQHPGLRAFAQLVEETAADGVPSLADVQSRPFSAYWPNLMIVQKLPEQDTFMFRLFGSKLVDAFGRDMTGKLISDIGNEKVGNEVVDRHAKVLTGRQPIYVENNFYWSPRDYLKWVQVIFPLRRAGDISDTLSCVYFE